MVRVLIRCDGKACGTSVIICIIISIARIVQAPARTWAFCTFESFTIDSRVAQVAYGIVYHGSGSGSFGTTRARRGRATVDSVHDYTTGLVNLEELVEGVVRLSRAGLYASSAEVEV